MAITLPRSDQIPRKNNIQEVAVVFHGGARAFEPEPGFPRGRGNLSFQGAGEGGIAGGWGFYTGQARGTGEFYQITSPDGTVGGKKMDWNDPSHEAAMWVHTFDGNAKEAVEFLEDVGQGSQEAIDLLRHGVALPMYTPELGALYKMELPDEDIAKFLHWDLTFDEQPESVQDGLRRLWASLGGDPSVERPFAASSTTTGDGIYAAVAVSVTGNQKLTETAMNKEASFALKDVGIPGNKFLDQFSRDPSGASAKDVAMRVLNALGGDIQTAKAEMARRIESSNMAPGDPRTKIHEAMKVLEQGDPRTFNFVVWDQDVLDRTELLELNDRVFPEEVDSLIAEDTLKHASGAKPEPQKVTQGRTGSRSSGGGGGGAAPIGLKGGRNDPFRITRPKKVF